MDRRIVVSSPFPFYSYYMIGRGLIVSEGWRGLYRGSAAVGVGVPLASGLHIVSLEYSRSLFYDLQVPEHLRNGLSGAVSIVGNTFVQAPFEVIQQRMIYESKSKLTMYQSKQYRM